MAYFEYDQIQLLEEITNRYMNEFPECDLTKKAVQVDLSSAFKKDSYTEDVRSDVIDRIESGIYEEDDNPHLTEVELDNVTRRVMNWADYSTLNDNIDEAIAEELRNRENTEKGVS